MLIINVFIKNNYKRLNNFIFFVFLDILKWAFKMIIFFLICQKKLLLYDKKKLFFKDKNYNTNNWTKVDRSYLKKFMDLI